MLKKLTSLLLSLLLSLSLLPGQARAADEPDPAPSAAIVEPLYPEEPGEPEEPVLPQSEELPEKEEKHL